MKLAFTQGLNHHMAIDPRPHDFAKLLWIEGTMSYTGRLYVSKNILSHKAS